MLWALILASVAISHSNNVVYYDDYETKGLYSTAELCEMEKAKRVDPEVDVVEGKTYFCKKMEVHK